MLKNDIPSILYLTEIFRSEEFDQQTQVCERFLVNLLGTKYEFGAIVKQHYTSHIRDFKNFFR